MRVRSRRRARAAHLPPRTQEYELALECELARQRAPHPGAEQPHANRCTLQHPRTVATCRQQAAHMCTHMCTYSKQASNGGVVSGLSAVRVLVAFTHRTSVLGATEPHSTASPQAARARLSGGAQARTHSHVWRARLPPAANWVERHHGFIAANKGCSRAKTDT